MPAALPIREDLSASELRALVRRQGPGRLPKEGLREALKAAAAAHPDRRLQLCFQDEARIGQKGRTAHRWWERGQRPAGLCDKLCDKRFPSAYLYAAVCPASGADFALVMPTVSTAAMSVFLGRLLPDPGAGRSGRARA